MTPLQALLALRIIEQYPHEHFVAIMITYFDNDKYAYYFQKLQKRCSSAHFFPVLAIKPLPRIWALYKLKKLLRNYTNEVFQRCFIASIDNTFAQLIASQINYMHLESYDDGTANLDYQGAYYQAQHPNLVHRFIRSLIGIHLNTQQIREISRMHHTIYPNQKNIIKEINTLSLIPLMTLDHNQDTKKHKTIKIFLGQPVTDLGLNTELIQTLCQQYNIDYYFPHPREKEQIEGLNYIKTPLIFEDYILSQLVEDPKINIVLYHFISTAALNVIALPQVQAFSLYSPTLWERFEGMYLLFQKNGMNLLKLP